MRSKYGECCEEMKEALDANESLFRVEEDDILRLPVWTVPLSDEGKAWYEKPIIFCPFCGKRLQDLK